MTPTETHEPGTDLSLIYSEIYLLAIHTCKLSPAQADRWACWYCATGGHIDAQAHHPLS